MCNFFAGKLNSQTRLTGLPVFSKCNNGAWDGVGKSRIQISLCCFFFFLYMLIFGAIIVD
ncbi:hypothetical protein MAPG_00077 [Magnaporthiopsis poae ATCC 64411]|uniref:Uncharacterized protein n=1 Tax=Magnaporthiopsis poae (strain ATCC 64411 / 73-15) TaxID=644358 RepID=A0A0C4DK14_MAGP6|nr:hypothetical protein MAPG_00077 [Magnaporthiopsis poae ATCC 64411]